MSEESQTPPESSPSTGSKPDPVANLKAMPMAEKLLLSAALAGLIAFIIKGGFKVLFKYVWFPTCLFLGSLGVIVLIALALFGIKFMDAKMRNYLLILLAVIPALGFVIDQLSMLRFWDVVMVAAAIVMAYAGAKITSREQIIKKD